MILIALAVAALGAVYVSNSYGYTTTSTAWNGLADFTSEMHVKPMSNLSSLSSMNSSTSALFMAQPVISFSHADSLSIKGFLSRGGLLIIGANNGTTNELLSSLGISLQLSSTNVFDPVLNYGLQTEPLMSNAINGTVSLRNSIVFNSPVALNFTGGTSVLHSTSAFSYARLSGLTVTRSYPMIASVAVGNGTLVLMSTPSIFLNEFFNIYGNHNFISSLVGSRASYIDTSHWSVPLLTIWQEQLLSRFTYRTIAIFESTLITALIIVLELMSGIFLNRRIQRVPKKKEPKPALEVNY